MKYNKDKNTIYLRIDKDENVIESIKYVCGKEKVFTGYFQGIGACDLATLLTYIPEKHDFIEHTVKGMLEMVSLFGNINEDNTNNPFIHSHASFSYLNSEGKVELTAGHLKDAHISYTGEIIINIAGIKIQREIDKKTDIEVWKL